MNRVYIIEINDTGRYKPRKDGIVLVNSVNKGNNNYFQEELAMDFRVIDSEDKQMIEGFQMMLEGLKKLPLTVCLSVFIDDFTTISVSNYDVDGEKKFHIHLHHDYHDSTKQARLACKHDSKRIVFDLVDSLNRGYESEIVRNFFDLTEKEAAKEE
jgi:hypothetical protein